MTERTRLRIQAAEMGFLRRVADISLRGRVRSLVIWEGHGVEPLLLCVERSQLRWFGHLARPPPGRLPREVFQARPAWRRPRGRGPSGGTIAPRWPGNASGSPSQSWLMWPGKGKFGEPCWNCYHATRFWISG